MLFVYLPPRPLGTPPSRREGNLSYYRLMRFIHFDSVWSSNPDNTADNSNRPFYCQPYHAVILAWLLDKSPFVSMPCSCHAFGMLVPRLWHDCDKPLAQLCQALCTTVSEVWHNHFRRWHNRSDSLSQTVCILERETTKGEVLVTVWNEGSSRTQKRRFFLLTVVWMT